MVYLDLRKYRHITPKIFLRTDIWDRITAEGFREASHITRSITIQWDKASLMNLVIKRALAAAQVAEYYNVRAEEVLADIASQETLFDRIFPPKVEMGGGRPRAFDWMLTRTQDATRRTAPRELIHLLVESRNVQLKKQEIGEPPPDGEVLIAGHNIKEALTEVSKVRLNQTLTAEFPQFRQYVMKLRGGKTEHSVASLAEIWAVDTGQAAEIADQLVEVGFFERRGTVQKPDYWVPFLYRAALDMIRGAAD